MHYTVREFVELASRHVGVDIRWKGQGVGERGFDSAGKCIVAVDPRYFQSDGGRTRSSAMRPRRSRSLDGRRASVSPSWCVKWCRRIWRRRGAKSSLASPSPGHKPRFVNQFRSNLVANFVGTGWAAVIQLACVPFFIKLMGIKFLRSRWFLYHAAGVVAGARSRHQSDDEPGIGQILGAAGSDR